MPRSDDDRHAVKPPRRIIWIFGGLLVLAICLIAFQGLFRSVADAVGVENAAPGAANASPENGTERNPEG